MCRSCEEGKMNGAQTPARAGLGGWGLWGVIGGAIGSPAMNAEPPPHFDLTPFGSRSTPSDYSTKLGCYAHLGYIYTCVRVCVYMLDASRAYTNLASSEILQRARPARHSSVQ